jgi:hypothetical protein
VITYSSPISKVIISAYTSAIVAAFHRPGARPSASAPISAAGVELLRRAIRKNNATASAPQTAETIVTRQARSPNGIASVASLPSSMYSGYVVGCGTPIKGAAI